MPPAPPQVPTIHPVAPLSSDPTVWDRISTWVSDNKAVVYTIAGVAVVVTAVGAVYYVKNNPAPKDSSPRPSKKERRKKKQAERDEAEKATTAVGVDDTATESKAASVESADELPDVTEESVAALSNEDRKDYAAKLKEAGNKAYGSKDFNKAIDLYSRAIICKADPVYYSNRAACYNAMSQWDKVIEDTTAALNVDAEYVKALNRRGNAYEHLEMYSEALLDFTASCIIDNFRNQQTAKAVEDLLKKFAETKAKDILESKPSKLPSSSFVSNYLQSFRVKPRPAGLGESVELPENTGKGQLQRGLRALENKTGEAYEEADTAFEEALKLGDLGNHEALAYNMRGTFRCLKGKHDEALQDLSKSIELDPTMTQSYIKRASMNLELGAGDKAEEDFTNALKHNPDDPDIYYHRAQLHFIQTEFSEAAKDYQKSIDLDRDFIFSHIQLGVTQYKMGSIASSMATFRRCSKNFDKTPDVYNYWGEIMLDQGKFEDAIAKFDTAMEMEKATKPMAMNVLPLINKALALFQSKQDFVQAEQLCQKALIIDPECDMAVATMAQLLLQQGKVTEALKYFERTAELARTEGELVSALSYAEATRTQILVQEKYPQLAAKLSGMGSAVVPR